MCLLVIYRLAEPHWDYSNGVLKNLRSSLSACIAQRLSIHISNQKAIFPHSARQVLLSSTFVLKEY
ncbi:hypothetical protein IF2G_10992 [Cordyceps javanica]|nr:hypothetical protein IF2G_10992 [Cordyceps javanica]